MGAASLFAVTVDDFASPTERQSPVIAREDVLGIRAMTFTWSEQSREPVVSGNTRSFALRIDELTFEEGSINLIVGPTGSGKTALLWALLGMLTTVPLSPERCADARFLLPGEMHAIPNGPHAYIGLPRARGVAYVPQESWILSDTIKVIVTDYCAADEA